MTLVVAIGATIIEGATLGAVTSAAVTGSTIGSIGAGVIGGATLGSGLGAVKSAIAGEDVGKGALMGAATGAVGGGLAPGVGAAATAAGEVGGTAGQIAGGALAGGASGAVANATGAAVGGKPIGTAALTGGITGGVLGGIAGSASNAPPEGVTGPPAPEGITAAMGGPNISDTQALMGLGTVGTAAMAENQMNKKPEAPANVTPGLAPGLTAALRPKDVYTQGPIGGMGSIGMARGGHVPVRDGAYIIPADVVSALGNGSSKAGAEFLRKLMEQVKTQGAQRHGLGAARRALA